MLQMKCIRIQQFSDDKVLVDSFGEIGVWLFEQFNDFVDRPSFNDNYEYADNFRIADMSDNEMMNDLKEKDVCCGSGCWTFRHPSGRYFLLAWNYGH